MTLHFYTYYTHPEKAAYLLKSAEFHGITVKNLWDGRPWAGLWNKFELMEETIRGLPDSDTICFIDAYDLIINSNEEKIIETFKAQNCELLFGAEANLDPGEVGTDNYPQSPTKFRFLNSGVYIGYVSAMKKMLRYKNYIGMNDQKYSHEYFLEKGKEENIKLDYTSLLVINMFGVPWTDLNVESGHIVYVPTNYKPCFVHFNGMSHLDVFKDFARVGNQLQFNYNAVHDRLLCALYSAKFLTKHMDLICRPTGRGSTY